MTQVHGSRRQLEKPYVPPEVLAQGPPPGLLAALAPAPSKKRKSVCEYMFYVVVVVVVGVWCGGLTAAAGNKRQHAAGDSRQVVLTPPAPAASHACADPGGEAMRSCTPMPTPCLAAGAPVPADAPFEPTYLHARLPVAAEDELQQVRHARCGRLGGPHARPLTALPARRPAALSPAAGAAGSCCSPGACLPAFPTHRHTPQPCLHLPPSSTAACRRRLPPADAGGAGAQGADCGGGDKHSGVPGGQP